MVNYPVARMACLEGLLHFAVFVKVKIDAKLPEFQHVPGTFLYKHLDSICIILVFSCRKRIGDMQGEIVVDLIKYAGYAALCKRAV